MGKMAKSELCEQRDSDCVFVQDGILYRGDVYYYKNGKCWERHPSNKEDELWNAAPLKIMFLMKDYTNDSMDDVRYETGRNNNVSDVVGSIKRDHFTRNIYYWLYGIAHQNVSFFELKDERCFHFYERYPLVRINCKKVSSSNNCPDSLLRKFLNDPEYSSLLKEQIELFNADIIVCCGGSIASFVRNHCFNQNEWSRFEEESLWYSEKTGTLIIGTYHPSYYGVTQKDLYEGIIGCFDRFVLTNTVFQKKLSEMYAFENTVLEQMPINYYFKE